jgi:transcriptional regulator GlxA family with amidase domain
MRIGLAMLDGAFDSGVSALLDLFSTAAVLSGRRFDVTRLGPRRSLRTGQGAVYEVTPYVAKRRRFDHLIVPGFACADVEAVQQAMAGADARRLQDFVVGFRGSLHAACTGTWVLASAGVLDGHEATTSWWYAEAFRQCFPKVRLDARQSVVRSGRITTAGAAFSHIDLGLALLRTESPTLAERVSNHLVTESRASQAMYLVEHHARVDDPTVRRFEALADSRLREPFSLEVAARTLGTSSRTLLRKVQRATGQRPLQLVQKLRLRRSLALLREGQLGLEQIAEAVGYRSAHTLRLLIRRELAVGVRELRARG